MTRLSWRACHPQALTCFAAVCVRAVARASGALYSLSTYAYSEQKKPEPGVAAAQAYVEAISQAGAFIESVLSR